MKNVNEVRMVRTYVSDLCIGDVVMDIGRQYVGTVDSVPDWDRQTGKVSFVMLDNSGQQVDKKVNDNTVIRIEIPRRLA